MINANSVGTAMLVKHHGASRQAPEEDCNQDFGALLIMDKRLEKGKDSSLGCKPAKPDSKSSFGAEEIQTNFSKLRSTNNVPVGDEVLLPFDEEATLRKKQLSRTCGVCNRMFSAQSTLNRHMSTVHSKQLCACSVCGVEFSRKDTLQRHFRRAHNEPHSGHAGFASGKEKPEVAQHRDTGHLIRAYTFEAEYSVVPDVSFNNNRQESPRDVEEIMDNIKKYDNGLTSEALGIEREKMRRIEEKLQQLILSSSDLRRATELEAEENPEYDSESSWSEIDPDEDTEDTVSYQSADSSWVLPISSHQNGEPRQSPSGSSTSSASPSQASATSKNGSVGSGSKRKHSDISRGDGGSEESNDGSLGLPPCSQPADEGKSPPSSIPCCIDGCPGRDYYASGLV